MEHEAVINLAESMGTTAEYLWGVLLSAAPKVAAFNLAIGLLLLAAFAVPVAWLARTYWTEEGDLFPPVIAVVAGLLFLAWPAAFCFYDWYLATVVPEYWALDQVLSALGPRK